MPKEKKDPRRESSGSSLKDSSNIPLEVEKAKQRSNGRHRQSGLPGGAGGRSQSGENLYLGISTHKITKSCSQAQKEAVFYDVEASGKHDQGWWLSDVGVVLHGVQTPGNPEGKGAPSRGKISGWSGSSRRRMRSFLFEKTMPENWSVAGVTLTIPGLPLGDPFSSLSGSSIREQWRQFGQSIKRQGWAMVWRLELQERGQPHYHCIVSVPPETSRKDAESTLKSLWYRRLDNLPEPIHKELKSIKTSSGKKLRCFAVWGRKVYTDGADFSRSRWTGCRDYFDKEKNLIPGRAVHVQWDGESGAWYRYLQDHATKAKQGQIAEDFGRHWGVINRNLFISRESVKIKAFDEQTYYRVRRWVRRLRSPVCRSPKSPFGKKLRMVPPGNYSGSRVLFGSKSTYQKMIVYATELRQKELEKENF